MARLSAVATALPRYVFAQEEVRAACEPLYADQPRLLRLLRIFERVGVRQRHFCYPIDYYLSDRTYEQRNADFAEPAGQLAESAVRQCLDQAKVRPDEVDHLFFVTTTGLATPSLDAHLVGRLGLRGDVVRSPLFGLGCAGGAAGLSRAAQFVSGAPEARAIVLSVELCGQVFSLRALEPVDVVGTALFGDGAVAVLVSGDKTTDARGPRVTRSKSVLFENTEKVMGWRFTGEGMRLVLSQDVPEIVASRLKNVLERFTEECGVRTEDVAYWILHPGGRRVIESYAAAFGLKDSELAWTRRSIENVGNLSSASVLFILADVMASGDPRPGDRGLMCALGPGFAAELLMLEW